ncbi:MAG: MFS transporter [Actinobacteria bacterium]|nr:MFS transporter [Actinomycetota bacterium]
MTTRRSPAVTAAVAVSAFLVLGMPKAAFGVAWPSMAGDLTRDLADLGTAVAVFVGGYLVGTLTVGRLAARFGMAPLLTAGATVATVGVIGYATAGSWPHLLGAAVVLGVGGGWLDAGVNAHVALHRSARVMGWIHAGFGIGSALGPLLMTGLLALDAGWRPGFWIIAGLQALILAGLVSSFRSWEGTGEPPPPGRVPFRPVVLLALAVFLFYVGIEVAVAQWAFTLFTEGRGLGEGVAGLAVTGFWVALTAVRVLLGIAGDRTAPAPVAGWAALAVLGCTLVLWWSPADWVDPAALIALGAALGPIFPIHMLLTPRRVGAGATTAMVGYQMAAASTGAALIPGGLGPLVGWFGIGVVAPVLVIAAAAQLAVTEALRRARAS